MYPPEYLAENRGQQLLNVAIVFGVLETVFIVLFFVSRIIFKTANGPEMYLMPLAYITCFSHVILIPRKSESSGLGTTVLIASS